MHLGARAVADPVANRLRDGRYEFEGTGYLLPLTEPDKHNAIHGLVRWATWTPADRTEGSVARSVCSSCRS